jgi:HAE1 family hydrophobic/amphiphilic exporter-1
MVKKSINKVAKKSTKVESGINEQKIPKDNLLVKTTDFFFTRWRLTIVLWIFILGMGAAVYTNIIKREGFPPIQFPISVVTGTYLVNDKTVVDEQVALPLNEVLQEIDGVSKVTINSNDNFFTAIVNFDTDVKSDDGTSAVQEAIDSTNLLPEQVDVNVLRIDPAAFLNQYDLLLSVYSTEPVDINDLQKVADFVSADFANDPLITDAETKQLIKTATNPQTGERQSIQSAFNLIVLPDESGNLAFHPSVVVGIDRDKEAIDIIELSKLVQTRIDSLDLAQFGENYSVVIGADFATTIENQVSSLQSNLVTGLLAVALVTFLLISWRASIITGLFMVTVMAATVLVLYLVGYTLNTITLFALVLSLGLFVDDATIVVESIYAHRKKGRSAREAVHLAVKKIATATFAGTMTTVLVFLPLAFLTGILGEFIRLMPVTVIIALITSLILSLTLIPVLSKFILLNHTTDGWITKHNPIVKFEAYLGRQVSRLPRLLKLKPAKGKIVMTAMLSLSLLFLVGAGIFFNKVSFNIFPPSKDSDQIGLQITFPAGFTIEQAEETAQDINAVVVEVGGDNIKRITYGSYQESNERSADALVELLPFRDREVKSPQLIEDFQTAIDENIPSDVTVRVVQYDAGPPSEEFPLKIQIFEEDQIKATDLATEIRDYITGAEVTRPNGTTATIIETRGPNEQTVTRTDGQRTLQVEGSFDADDTSALLASAETLVSDKFTSEYLVENGFSPDALGFDFGQESENADSFASLAFAFPIALLLMYILLALQFRSFLQPILIFMAIPFTLFGVASGLYFTDNSLSFFVQVGLIGLIGVAVNNTILLTEYANQEKRAGEGTIDAISNAVQKRFRPLVATTITTVVALLPLALSDPFWEALSFTIIFGLISSTFLVIFSFPYFYLVAEWLRMRISKGTRKARKLKKKTA